MRDRYLGIRAPYVEQNAGMNGKHNATLKQLAAMSKQLKQRHPQAPAHATLTVIPQPS